MARMDVSPSPPLLIVMVSGKFSCPGFKTIESANCCHFVPLVDECLVVLTIQISFSFFLPVVLDAVPVLSPGFAPALPLVSVPAFSPAIAASPPLAEAVREPFVPVTEPAEAVVSVALDRDDLAAPSVAGAAPGTLLPLD